jgi:hypothetical protein
MRHIATKILLFIGISTVLFSGFLLYQSYALTHKRIEIAERKRAEEKLIAGEIRLQRQNKTLVALHMI